jgi:hypothetical protein
MKNEVLLQTAREAAAKQKRRRGEIAVTNVSMFCDNCGTFTAHKLYCNGEWERYQCACGTSKEYRVR